MSEIAIEITAPEAIAQTVLAHLKNGKIEDAIACFAEKFTFKDHGMGFEFTDKERLTEFFWKTRELYPDSFLETETVFVSWDHVIMEWTLHNMVTEPFFGGLSRTVQVSVPGVSIVRAENGKITDWADYYDGRTSRRTALAAHFEEWVEL